MMWTLTGGAGEGKKSAMERQKQKKELVQKYQQMPILLRRMKDNPNFAKKVISEATKLDEQE